MNWIETIILIFLVFTIVLTAIKEPQVTWEYSKAMVRSGKSVVGGTINIAKSFVRSPVNITNSSEINESVK